MEENSMFIKLYNRDLWTETMSKSTLINITNCTCISVAYSTGNGDLIKIKLKVDYPDGSPAREWPICSRNVINTTPPALDKLIDRIMAHIADGIKNNSQVIEVDTKSLTAVRPQK
jgi:hypothetical protein